MMIHTPPPPPPQPMPITIFVHGTQMHALFKDVDMRPIIPAATQTPPGLIAAKTLSENLVIHTLFTTLSHADAKQFPFEGMYAFGWSGGIQVSERCAAGKELFQLICALTQEYKHLHGAAPEITLITHSHGGNVALHMAECCKKDVPFSLKRTLLLACPVQERTAAYPSHPLFQKIYSLHSHDDRIQIMDQGSLQLPRAFIEAWQHTKSFSSQECVKIIQTNRWQLGSGRHFATHPHLIQAALAWQTAPNHLNVIDKGLLFERALYAATHPFSFGSRGILHTEFTTPLFFTHIPKIVQKLDAEWATNGPVSHCLSHFIAGN